MAAYKTCHLYCSLGFALVSQKQSSRLFPCEISWFSSGSDSDVNDYLACELEASCWMELANRNPIKEGNETESLVRPGGVAEGRTGLFQEVTCHQTIVPTTEVMFMFSRIYYRSLEMQYLQWVVRSCGLSHLGDEKLLLVCFSKAKVLGMYVAQGLFMPAPAASLLTVSVQSLGPLHCADLNPIVISVCLVSRFLFLLL